MKINSRIGHLQDWITQLWVKATGRRFNPENDEWLIGPIGDTDIIKDKFVYEIAQKENLEIQQNINNSGLLETFNDLELKFIQTHESKRVEI